MKQAVRQFASLATNVCRKKRITFVICAIFFIILSIVFLGDTAYAQDETAGNVASEASGGGLLASMTNNVVNAIILGAAYIFGILSSIMLKMSMFFLRFFIELAGYNNFINAPAVIVGWFMVRDIANMFFIVALLIIAFSTILGIEKYEWQKALGYLIIAAILINFSRLLLGWVIDISHVFMVAFLNAIQGAAGGNLIQMLKMDKMLAMSGQDLTFFGDTKDAGENLRLDLFAASFAGFMFSLMAMLSIGAYAVVLLVRVLVLWMLIILSPLAFVAQTIPQAKSYASEFWQEFTKYVLVGPMAVFFLWLAFASLGNGDIGNHVGISGQTDAETSVIGNSRKIQSVTLSEATRWDNLSAYFIAIGFLFLGLERVSKLGVKGGSIVSGAASFGGKVATIASGYTAGRWLAGKGIDAGKDYAKIGAYNLRLNKLPIIGTQAGAGRKAALSKYQEVDKQRIEQAGLESRFGKILGPSKTTRANQAIATSIAQKKSKGEYDEVEGMLRINKGKKEEKAIKEKYDELARREMARTGSTDIDVARKAELLKEASKGHELHESLYAEGQGKAKSGKAQSEEKRFSTVVDDTLRRIEGKDANKALEWEDAENKDDSEKMNRKDYDALMSTIDQNYTTIKTLKSKPKLSDIEKTRLKNAVQEQMRAISSAYERGYGEFLAGKLSDLDHSFADIDFADPNTNHVLDMALTSGGTRADFEDASGSMVSANARAKQQDVQEEFVRKNLKEKQGAIMRGLMRAKNKDASDHGSIESNHQLRVGKNQLGDDVVGWSNLMTVAGGVGTADSLASGATGDGAATRAMKTGIMQRTMRLSQIGGGSLLSGDTVSHAVTRKPVPRGYASSEIEGKIATLGSMTAAEIGKLKKDQIYRITGGGYDRSSWDTKLSRFVVSPDIEAHLGAAFQEFRNNYEAANGNANEEQIVRKSLTKFLQEADVPRTEINRIVTHVAQPGGGPIDIREIFAH